MKPETYLTVTEDQFQKRITDLCDWYHLRWHHEVDSRKSKSGFPDLVIVGPGWDAVLWAELKTDKGRVSPEQREWLLALDDTGAEVRLWRPKDWPEIDEVLRLMKRGHGRRSFPEFDLRAALG